jgi:hypothetical protein
MTQIGQSRIPGDKPLEVRMARVVELKPGELPPAHERHALVLGSPEPPAQGVPCVDNGRDRTFFATDSERDIALVVERAKIWADARLVANVYVRRDPR